MENNKDKIKIGYYIRQKRDQKGWSQEDLAEEIGVSVPTISAWENGKSMPMIDRLPKLAIALDVTTYDIIAGKDHDELSAEDKEAIARRFMSLNEKVDDVEDNSFTLEDRIIMATDIARAALSCACIALSIAVWGVFPHTILNKVGCTIMFVTGIGFMIFGRSMIKIMERQLKERKDNR